MPTKKKTSSKAVAKAPRKAASRKAVAKPARASSKSSGALSLRSAAPGFTVNDIEASLAFYRDVLGFAVKERWEEKGQLLGLEMSAGQVSFMLTQDDWKKGRDREKGQGVRMYCATGQDVDRIAARIKSSGGRLTLEPNDNWGRRTFSLDDPDGYKITIGSELKN